MKWLEWALTGWAASSSRVSEWLTKWTVLWRSKMDENKWNSKGKERKNEWKSQRILEIKFFFMFHVKRKRGKLSKVFVCHHYSREFHFLLDFRSVSSPLALPIHSVFIQQSNILIFRYKLGLWITMIDVQNGDCQNMTAHEEEAVWKELGLHRTYRIARNSTRLN